MGQSNFTVLGKIIPNDATRAGRMLAGGRLKVTMISKKTGQHLTLEYASKKEQKNAYPKWKSVMFGEASHVFVKTTGGDRIGTYYPNSQRFYPARGADPARVWAATHILTSLHDGVTDTDKFSLQEADQCGKCGRELTDPVSIQRGLGPDCFGAVTESIHQQKQRQAEEPKHAPQPAMTVPAPTPDPTPSTDAKGRDVPASFAELAARVQR